jgi:oxygen-independent coproporphyrinogen-3 oxidase
MGQAKQSMALSAYVHIPFCQVRCTYCDFNTYAGLEPLFQPYVEALIAEVNWLAARFSGPLNTLYLGGGTPTRLPADMLQRILVTCQQTFGIRPEAEISCEANPGTLSPAGLAALRQAGFNRLSLGAQSFNPAELTMLGRIHSAGQTGLTVRQARAAGFDNLSLDLIYGLPGQTLKDWQTSLEQALALAPQHLSLYCLGLEPGTRLAYQVARGELPTPDADLAADMYELAGERLAAAGYAQYEISNWCRPGYECAHNLVYWRKLPYLGLGAGAHSSTGDRRWWNVYTVPDYVGRMRAAGAGSTAPWVDSEGLLLSSVQFASPSKGTNGRGEHRPPAQGTAAGWPSPAVQDGELLDRAMQMGETMMLGLRLTNEGVAEHDFRERFGVSLAEIYGEVIGELARLGLVTWQAGRVQLSERGRLLGNQVFVRFLPG